MKLSKIQEAIYEEYRLKGEVWAECPRQSGKTELLLKIAEIELKCGNKVYIQSANCRMKKDIIRKLKLRLNKNWVKYENKVVYDDCGFYKEKDCDVLLYDEVYYDIVAKPINKKIVCLRTLIHPTLRFTYKDLEKPKRKWILAKKKAMSAETFEVEFNGG